jgi:hypothetical protein
MLHSEIAQHDFASLRVGAWEAYLAIFGASISMIKSQPPSSVL